MLDLKLDIQKFGGGADASWTQGITASAVDTTYDQWHTKIQEVCTDIMNFANVDSALQDGWSGTDREKFLEKFHEHAGNVCTQIEEYDVKVKAAAEDIKAQWEEFQSNLIG